MRHLAFIILACILAVKPAEAEPANSLTYDQLKMLTANGIKLKLGAPAMGYEGELILQKNGRGKGQAKTANGNTINISGTWSIKGDRFCRTWEGIDGGREVCETWSATSKRSVDVYNGDQKIGANSW